MRTVKLLVYIALLAALTVMVGGAAVAQDATASVRFVHVIPGVSGLDVYVNNNLSVSGLGYGESTSYITAPSGELNIRVTLANVSSALWQQTISAPADSTLTLIASAADPLAFDVYEDSLASTDLGTTRFSIVHAIGGGANVDLVAEGQTIATSLAYRASLGTIDAPAGTYAFTVLPEGGTEDAPLLPALSLGLDGRTSYIVVLYGPATSPAVLVLDAPVNAEASAGFVSVTHGADGAPNVDVLFNDQLVVSGLGFGESTVHFPVDAGDYAVSVRVAGGGTEVAALDVTVAAGEYQSIAALGTLDDLTVEAYTEGAVNLAANAAQFSLTNSIPGAIITVTLQDGTELFSNVGVGLTTSSVTIPATRQPLTLNISAGTVGSSVEVPVTTFYGGEYYNLIALRDGTGSFTIDVNSTNISRSINSAPGGSGEIVAAAPTVAPTEAAPQTNTETSVVTAPTATPAGTTDTGTQVIIPVAPVAPTLPTARVVLDPGANLQLREYPRSDAFSLGRAPNGTVFVVNGRVGAPIDILTGEEILLADETEFVDPVTLLENDREDLAPVDTWLNVSLTTPDGTVTAWINALYVDVRSPRGEQQKLRELPTIPQNQPGSSDGTIVSPPAAPENFARAVVFNLDPGIGLNIRRTPESSGEILARILNGDKTQLVGFGESGDWAFVIYESPEGGTVRGWASTLYLRYEYRERAIELDEMISRDLLDEVDEATLRGSVTAGTSPVAQPTVDPLRGVTVAQVVGLDAGIQLNLRRTPDTSAEVLLRIPSGATMRVISRSGSEAWLEVEFDGTTGWVASLYTVLSFNGRPVSITDVPVSETFSATATPTPTPAPTATPEA